jgi:hypothetical protein
MRYSSLFMFSVLLGGDSRPAAVERRLYVADASGVSVYDIDRGHAFVRKIAVPNSGAYKGIGASAPLGLLYLTSNRGDELIAISLATDSIVWRRNVGKYADSFWITPDGKRLWMPLRGETIWKVLDAATGDALGQVETERGKRYDVDPIADIGPHNTWMNPAGTRVYMEVLTVPYIYVADARSNQVLGKIGPFTKGIRPFAVSDDERVWIRLRVRRDLTRFEAGREHSDLRRPEGASTSGLDQLQHRRSVCLPGRWRRDRHEDQARGGSHSHQREVGRDRL